MPPKSKITTKELYQQYIFMFRFYFFPIFILAVFLLVGIFAVYPSVTTLFDNFSKVDELKLNSEKKQERISKLEALREGSGKTQEYLSYINRIAPIEKTRVTDFQGSISKISQQNNLEIKSARGGEEIIQEENSTDTSTLLVEVPMHFSITGPFQNLKNFLSDIYKGDDFIIIEEMELSKEDSSSDWTMQITLVKYQFISQEKIPDESGVDPGSSGDQLPEEANPEEVNLEDFIPNQDVLKFLDEKYINAE